jgi:hypothetical protein
MKRLRTELRAHKARSVSLVVGVTVVAVTLVLIGILGGSASGSATPAPEPTPADIQSALLESQITVTDAPDSADTAIPEEKAVDATRTVPGAGGHEPSAYLVRFTDDVHGTLKSEDDGEIERTWVDRLAWLVVYRETTQPIFGPPPRPGVDSTEGPTTYTSDLAAFVDASTGEFLEAVTINGLAPGK